MTAELEAFSKCGGGNCYLYAVGNKVVLPKRLRQARQPGTSLEDILAYILVSNPAGTARVFNTDKAHKSMVLYPEKGRIERFTGFSSIEAAEQVGLEACGLKYNTSCITLAFDDKLSGADPSSAPRRAMPRLTYQGPYRVDMVPLFTAPPTIVHDYVKMRSPKAMAIGPVGLKIAAETGATLADAESKALAKCTIPDSPFPCFLYAVNDNVILPFRRTEADR